MSKIEYRIERSIVPAMHDAANLVYADEDPRTILVEAIMETISTSIEISCGGVRMHLAAWMDPEHWEEDWRQKGIEDVDALIAEQVVES